ncbi:hypothetical protein [Micromonospora antibiotica]|uniref:Uncharacterized protein n=1 Tax=Micromonospora antibiotica TaxID=2807623 RepID=A0ABS3V126_9ACTN|nr:hypothetical protein [Micromonospora antibiotica]MBO4159316.1 hypothetical protein [Micromonospora antibiotica]
MSTTPPNDDATRKAQGLIANYIRAANDVNDKYKAPEVRAAAVDYMAWLENVIMRGITAMTDSD